MSSSKNNSAKTVSHARHNKHQKTTFGQSSTAMRVLTLAPLIGVLAILPLLVRLYTYDSGLQYFDFFGMTEKPDVDVFLHCKMVFFLFLSFVMACILIARLIVEKKNIKFSKIFIPLGVYALLALLSSIFSKYQPYPWTGVYEQFEPVFVLLGYVLTAYYAFLFVNDSKDITILSIALTAGTVLILMIGISQVFFTDFFQTNLGYKLIVPDALKAAYPKENMKFEFETETGSMVYLTLYNPNYVGSYAALLSPVFLMLIFAVKNIPYKIVCGFVYAGLILVLLGSKSRAGLVGIAFSMLVLLILFAHKSKMFWIPVGAVALISAGVFAAYIATSGSNFMDRIKEAISSTEIQEEAPLTRIETTDNDVVLTWHNKDLHITIEPETNSFRFFDSNGSSLPAKVSEDKTYLTLDDSRFEGIVIQISSLAATDDISIPAFLVEAGGTWRFAYYNNTYYFVTLFGKLIKYENSEYVDFLAKRSSFASMRGFIWSRTIPLLKDNLILGSGADTFVMEFPGTDFLAIQNSGLYRYSFQIVTKPHNMYLQVGVQTGVVSLIAMLVFYVMYLGACFVTSFKTRKHNFYTYISGGIAAGTFGYMITQLINDSSITVAPLFWALIGIGFSACLIARRENAEIGMMAEKSATAKG